MGVFYIMQILIIPISFLPKNNDSYHLCKTFNIPGPALDTLSAKTHRIVSDTK